MTIWLGRVPDQPWRGGWALDWHTVGHDGPGYLRSELGELVYRLKYSEDLTAAPALVDRLIEFLTGLWVYPAIAALVPVPPSNQTRKWQPVAILAQEVASRTGHRADIGWLVRVRAGTPLKELEDPNDREEVLSGAFGVTDPDRYRGKDLLLLDDVFRSGATLRECAKTMLRDGSCRAVYAVTITRTRKRS